MVRQHPADAGIRIPTPVCALARNDALLLGSRVIAKPVRRLVVAIRSPTLRSIVRRRRNLKQLDKFEFEGQTINKNGATHLCYP